MKKAIFILSIISLLFGCSKDDDQNNVAETPEAKAQYDNSNYGLYKGVFVGSSGVIIIDMGNTNNVTATLIIDGTTYNLSPLTTVPMGQNTSVTFSDGTVSFNFVVTANGANPQINNIQINGHSNPVTLVVKETSTTLVKCYEGTYTGDDWGTFNGVIYGNIIKGLVDVDDVATGTVSNNQINAQGTVNTGATFIGTVSGNSISGTWHTSNFGGLSGTWSGTRTL